MSAESIARAVKRTRWAAVALNAAAEDLRAAGDRDDVATRAAAAAQDSAEQVAGLASAIEQLAAVAVP
jgi:hypothetical protein